MIARRLTLPESGSFFLFGPRGTGKSTWLTGSGAQHAGRRRGLRCQPQDGGELLRTARRPATRDSAARLPDWRTFDGKEVDFVLYGERGLHAVEVKRSSRFREPDLAGLRVFCAGYPGAKACLLYGGRQRYRFGKIDVIPLGEELAEMGERLA